LAVHIVHFLKVGVAVMVHIMQVQVQDKLTLAEVVAVIMVYMTVLLVDQVL
jgi:hypothetical protein